MHWMGAVRMRVQTLDGLVSKWHNANFSTHLWETKILLYILEGYKLSNKVTASFNDGSVNVDELFL